jgi:hypothetical protein
MARRAASPTKHASAFGLAGLLALAAAAPAGAEDYPECAKIDNPFAYNQCLAKHGPPEHATRATAPPEGQEGPRDTSGLSAGGGGARVRTTVQFSRGRNGKMIGEFTIGAAPPPVARKPRKTPQ